MAISGIRKIDRLERLTTVTVSGSAFTSPAGALPRKPSDKASAASRSVAASTQRLRRLSRISFTVIIQTGFMVCGFLDFQTV